MITSTLATVGCFWNVLYVVCLLVLETNGAPIVWLALFSSFLECVFTGLFQAFYKPLPSLGQDSAQKNLSEHHHRKHS